MLILVQRGDKTEYAVGLFCWSEPDSEHPGLEDWEECTSSNEVLTDIEAPVSVQSVPMIRTV